jgi:aspartyl-tRNA(Asn)/glutamyl-tRNA(Gln) amidotransferase subunit C
MSVTREDVRQIASLARLRVLPEYEEQLAEDLSRILDYVQLLQELDTDDVPPMAHAGAMDNVVREDVVEERLSRGAALHSSRDTDGTFFRVPKVIE